MISSIPYIDFTVDIGEARPIRVLQLTDTQIIDASQSRTPNRLTPGLIDCWQKDDKERNYRHFVRNAIMLTKPDLILITGDLVYGEFDDNGESLIEFVGFMDTFGIPWAPVFGNHDNDSKMGVDWQCETLKKAKNVLFCQRELTGNGNYTIGVTVKGILRRVFFMLDSNGCGGMSEESEQNGHSRRAAGFGSDQIAWFSETASAIAEDHPSIKTTFAFHIQPFIFAKAFAAYGMQEDGTLPARYDGGLDSVTPEGACGYLGQGLKGKWDTDYIAYNAMKKAGCDSILVGHEHTNSFGCIYDGVRFSYGTKSSLYDRYNKVVDGDVIANYRPVGSFMVGCTLYTLSETDGAITRVQHFYTDNIEKGDVV